MPQLHGLIANAVVLYLGLVGIWGVVQGIRHVPLDASFRAALFIAGGLGVLQVLVGGILLVLGYFPRDALHFLYGASLIVTLPLVYGVFGRRFTGPLIYGLACLFMAGLAIRAITTGR